MNAAQMASHIGDPMRAALGEMATKAAGGFLSNRLVRHLIIHWLPWPKGAPTLPEFVHSGDEDFLHNAAGFESVLERFVARRERIPQQPHPVFGVLSRQRLGRAHVPPRRSSPAAVRRVAGRAPPRTGDIFSSGAYRASSSQAIWARRTRSRDMAMAVFSMCVPLG